MNINLEIVHDNQNEGADDITISVTGVSLNLKAVIADFPEGLYYGNPSVDNYYLNINPAGTPSMTCDNGGMTLYVAPDNDFPTQSVTIEGYTLADRLTLSDKITKVIRQANGE